MADLNDKKQFGAQQPESAGTTCARCEQMLTDALDGILSPEDQSAFDLHLLHCEACTQRMAEAQRGVAWLEMLKEVRPEPSAMLLQNIFAQTSGASAAGPALVVAGSAGQHAGNVIPFRPQSGWKSSLQNFSRVALHPRLAMTAAMAFFSIALTLNLVGVHVSNFRMSDLKPSNLRQSFYQTNAHVIRYYDNLKVVYELESRVRDLQHSSNEAQPVQNDRRTDGNDDSPKQTPSKQKPSGGSSRKDNRRHEGPYSLAILHATEAAEHPDARSEKVTA